MIKNFIITFVVFMGVDLIWLGVVAKNLYAENLGYIMRTPPNWIAAVAFYILFVMGLMYFALYPALTSGALQMAIIKGALFGFITYATYDLTNLATLEGWPLKITIIDLIWGTVLGGLTTSLAYLIISRIGK